jgi:carbon monoxide dehydrogenase subunit G
MKIEGRRTIDAPRSVVWEALLDPEVLRKTLPGCEKLERVGEHRFEGALDIRVGPVQGKFQGTVELTDLDPENGYRLVMDGRGPAGFVKGDGAIRLEGEGVSTDLVYDVDAQVGGRIAGVGQRLLDSSSRVITRQALDGLELQLQARQAAAAGEPAEEIEAPTQGEFAAGFAKGMAEELVPPERRAPILVGVAIAVVVIALVLLYTCG